MKKGAALILSGLLILACIALLYASPSDFLRDTVDFRAFYCGTRAVDSGQSPYSAEPLRTCETTVAKEVGAQPQAPGLAIPAPLPGYTFAPLTLLAKLPFPIAGVTYDLVILFSTIVGVFLLRRLTAMPFAVVIAALVVGEAFQSLRFGQIVPIVLMLLVLAATLLEEGKHWLAAAALGGAMIEPHVAAPAAIAVFLFAPRTRVPLLAVALFLGTVSIAVLGVQQNLLYYHTVVPAQIHAEVHMNSYQFSLTNLLHQLGFSDRSAIALGDASYAGMLALGIAVAASLAKRTDRRAFLVLAPCAIALLGGPYVHLVQIVCAVPAALLLAKRFPENRLVPIALLLLAPPWLEMARAGEPWIVGLITAAIVFPIALITLRGTALRPWVPTALLAVVGITVTLLWQAQPHIQYDTRRALLPVRDGKLLAEVSWERYVGVVLSAQEPRYIIAKLPTWTGLLLLVAGAAGLAFGQDKPAAWAPGRIAAKHSP